MAGLISWLFYSWVYVYMADCFLLPHNAERSIYPTRRGNAVILRTPGCMTLPECLNRIKMVHSSSSPAVTSLGPPLSRDVVLNSIPEHMRFYNKIDSLTKLYSLTGGIGYEDSRYELQQLWLFPHYYILSLEDALKVYNEFPRQLFLKQNNNMYAELTNVVCESCFPIMASGMGGYIFIDLNTERVFEYSPFEDVEEDELIKEASLVELFKGVVLGFENGEFKIENGIAVSDESNIESDVLEEIDDTLFNKETQEESDDYMTFLSRERDFLKREKQIMKKEKNMMKQIENLLKEQGDIIQNQMHQRKIRSLSDGSLMRLRRNDHAFVKKSSTKYYKLPKLELYCGNMTTVCEQIRSAIGLGEPRRLCQTSSRKRAFVDSRATCGATMKMKGMDCNIYPFLSTSQSHSGETTAIIVPELENIILGLQLGRFFKTSAISDKRYRNRCYRVELPTDL